VIKGQAHRWYLLGHRREEDRALRQQANQILAADRRQRASRRTVESPAPAKAAPAPTAPHRYTLADLATLRKQGRVP
jgi:hypothetical protein